MDQLIPITGYANSYEELCNKIAEPGEFFNVRENGYFMTYCKQNGVEIGDTLEETDVRGWFQVKAELESNVNPNEGDVYIVGLSSPYTRFKAQYVNYVMTWVEDGTEEKKIVKNFKNVAMLTRSKTMPEEGVYYSIGKELPLKVFGVVSSWEPVGHFISYYRADMNKLKQKSEKSNPGEVAYVRGMYYIYTGKWEPMVIPEPIENVYNHVYETDSGEQYKLREGRYPGTLEYYSPR